jgi:hypothetical protein
MLARFCLYGFLKNQRYHEPFLVLALVEQGHSYLDVGLLIGFRELCVNLLEIPSGAIADLYGRRRAMIAAFVAYIAAFLLLASAPGLGLLFAAMGLYAVGEAFRSGTHKAMIFTWLKAQGREDEKAEVYGRTRSWSKRGSAVAALIAAAIAWMTGDFSGVLWFTAIPYTLGLINLATYPRWLDGEAAAAARRPLEVIRLTARGLAAAVKIPGLRRLLGESTAFEGSHKLAREYLQPLVEAAALALPVFGLLGLLGAGGDLDFRRTVIALSLVYFALGLLEGAASRRAGAFGRRFGAAAIALLWRLNLAGFAVLLFALVGGWAWLAIVAFVLQTGALQNLFRPLQLARYDDHTPPELQATVLSIEAQGKALVVAAAAPLVGWGIDRGAADEAAAVDPASLWPVAALGLLLALIAVVRTPGGPREAPSAG